MLRSAPDRPALHSGRGVRLAVGALLGLGCGALGPVASAGLDEEDLRPASRPGRLLILSVGINSYPGYSQFRNAVTDAEELSAKLAARAKGPFTGAVRLALTEEWASVEGVRQAFERLIKEARPQDAVVFTFSGASDGGHNAQGLTRTASDEVFLFAHGATGDSMRRASSASPPPEAIPLRTLGAWLARVQALRQVVVIDTCACKAGLDRLMHVLSERDAALGDSVARSILVLGIDGTGFDGPVAGNAPLTAALLAGLAGAADVGPVRDGVITALELEVSLPRLYLECLKATAGGRSRLRAALLGRDFAIASSEAGADQTSAAPAAPSRGVELDPPTQDSSKRPAPQAAEGRNFALMFATDQFSDSQRWAPLRNPIFDARTLKQELESSYGFEVTLLENPTFAATRDKIVEYQRRAFGHQDQLLVFVAGHGTYDEVTGEGYVVATDSRADAFRNPTPAWPNSQLRTAIDRIPCRHVLAVLDTCFGGTFDQRITEGGNRGGDLYADVETSVLVNRVLGYEARLYLTSGGKEYVPDGRPGAHSPFAAKLLAALRGGTGRKGLVTWTDLKSELQTLQTEPRAGTFGNSEPGADFLFLLKSK